MLSYYSNQVIKLKPSRLQFIIIPLFSIIVVCPLANCTTGYSDMQKAQDQSYHIALDSLPSSWDVKWSLDQSSIERLKMFSPEKDVLVRIFAFKGNLNIFQFLAIDTLLFGSDFPCPFDTLYVNEYERSAVRHKYIRSSESGLVIKTDIDLIWSEGDINYAYAIVLDYIDDSDSDIGIARSAIHLYPPPDKIPDPYDFSNGNILLDILDVIETLGAIAFVFVIPALLLVIWLIRFAWENIEDISAIKKFLIIFFSIASGPIIRYVFGLHWSSMIWVPLVSFFIVGLLVYAISS